MLDCSSKLNIPEENTLNIIYLYEYKIDLKKIDLTLVD